MSLHCCSDKKYKKNCEFSFFFGTTFHGFRNIRILQVVGIVDIYVFCTCALAVYVLIAIYNEYSWYSRTRKFKKKKVPHDNKQLYSIH